MQLLLKIVQIGSPSLLGILVSILGNRDFVFMTGALMVDAMGCGMGADGGKREI